MSDADDVFDLEDLRALLGRGADDLRTRPVTVGIVLAIIGASLALALVPHTLGTVGADAVDTGDDVGPTPGGAPEAQQIYQNSLTNLSLLLGPLVLVAVSVIAAFGGSLRAPGSRLSRVARVSLAAGAGIALGYVLFVLLGHLAYGETTEGFYVRQYPVTLRFGTIAVNALALAATTSVGSALAGTAGTLVAPNPRVERAEPVSDADAATGAASGAADATGEPTWDGVEDETPSGDEAVEGAVAEESGAPASVETSSRASDYRETGSTRDADTPRYDPDDRDWDGGDGD